MVGCIWVRVAKFRRQRRGRRTHVLHAQSQDMFALLGFAGLIRLGTGLCILGWTKILVGPSDELGETVGGRCARGARLLHGGLLFIAMGVGSGL